MTVYDPLWLEAAKWDIAEWAAAMPHDAQGRVIDWNWVAKLDLIDGIGYAREEDFRPGAGSDLHALLRWDYATRNCVESIIAQCSTTYMMDFDRRLSSYRLPRALAYANRRLNDEINLLIDRGVKEGRWTVTSEKPGRSPVTVLHPTPGYPYPVNDIQDDTAVAEEARKAYRAQKNSSRGGSGYSRGYSRNTFGSGSAGYQPKQGFGSSDDQADKSYPQPDWRNAYLPGRDVDTVMGIDIETTGIDPARVYIIDIGFEFMNMISPKPDGAQSAESYNYEQDYYDAGDAYGQARLSLGVPRHNAAHGNELIEKLTGIDVRTRGPESGLTPFDEYPDAQSSLLRRLIQQPYVAHNATFEHSYFMLNVEGYAESYRNGDITIIDTMPMSKQWDPGSAPDENHSYGNNTLDGYAKRHDALPLDRNERHLGLEDTHIMLVAMKNHLHELHAEQAGPWGPDGKSGIGGKHCKKRRY